jgi:hypothetical protein
LRAQRPLTPWCRAMFTCQPQLRYGRLKSLANILSKRIAIRLSTCQEMLCRASGSKGMNHLNQLRQGEHASDGHRDEEVSLQVWCHRLRSELGPGFDDLFAAEEQTTWWKRLHIRHETVSESQ